MRTRVASVVLLVAAAVAVLLVAHGGPAQQRVRLSVADVRGLVPGADVRVAGVPVGRVDAVGLDGAARPLVTVSVDRDARLTTGTRAAVRLLSQSGEFNRYVALDPGRGRPLPDGATLRAQAPMEVDQALAALGPHTRAQLRGALAGLARATAGQGPALAQTLKAAPDALAQLRGAAADVSADGAALRTLVGATQRVTAALAADPGALTRAVAQVRAVLGVTARRADALRGAVAGAPGALRAAQGALATTRASLGDLTAAVRAAAPVTRELGPGATELRAAARAAGPALAATRRLAVDAPAQLRAVTPLLREAAPVLARATPVLRRLGPMLDQLRVRLPDAFSFFANWADFTSNYDANGHGARVGIVLPPAPTTTLAPWSDGAGQLRAPYLRTPGSLAGEPWTDYAQSFVAGGRPAVDARGDGGGGR